MNGDDAVSEEHTVPSVKLPKEVRSEALPSPGEKDTVAGPREAHVVQGQLISLLVICSLVNFHRRGE